MGLYFLPEAWFDSTLKSLGGVLCRTPTYRTKPQERRLVLTDTS